MANEIRNNETRTHHRSCQGTYMPKIGFIMVNLFIAFLWPKWASFSRAHSRTQRPKYTKWISNFLPKIPTENCRNVWMNTRTGKSLFIWFCAGFSCQLLFRTELMASVYDAAHPFPHTHNCLFKKTIIWMHCFTNWCKILPSSFYFRVYLNYRLSHCYLIALPVCAYLPAMSQSKNVHSWFANAKFSFHLLCMYKSRMQFVQPSWRLLRIGMSCLVLSIQATFETSFANKPEEEAILTCCTN